MAEQEDDLRATTEDIRSDAEELAAIEDEKARLDSDDPHLRALSRRGERIARAVGKRFEAAQFPFLGSRLIPRIAVQSTAGETSLETGLRNPRPWSEDQKRALIARGYALLDDVLEQREVA